MATAPARQFFVGHFFRYRKDPLAYLTMCAQEHGDEVLLQFASIPVLFINNPKLIEQVLVTANKSFRKPRPLRMNPRLLGQGLLSSEGEFWLRQRRLAQPAFHRDRIAAYSNVMVDFTEQMLTTWSDGERRDIHAEMMRLTSDIVAKTLFDAQVGKESAHISAAFHTILAHWNRRINSIFPLPESLPIPSHRRVNEALAVMDQFIMGIIQQRRTSGEDAGDLLSMLLLARDEDGSQMSEQQVRDEVMTIFLAGHETTANALVWTWYLLAQNPAVADRLRAELDGVLGGRSPRLGDLPQLLYTEAVILESMRVLPPVWSFGREAITDVTIGTHHLKPGAAVFISQWVTHKDARWFPEPLAFSPERWLDGLAKRLPAYAYFPFGGGPRICIGKSFAMMEAVLLLATMAQRFQLRLAPGFAPVLEPSITLRPKHGIQMDLTRRQS